MRVRGRDRTPAEIGHRGLLVRLASQLGGDLAKAGKRFLRSYKKKRLKVTLRFTARHRPATGTVQQRRFARRVTLRVKRTRR